MISGIGMVEPIPTLLLHHTKHSCSSGVGDLALYPRPLTPSCALGVYGLLTFVTVTSHLSSVWTTASGIGCRVEISFNHGGISRPSRCGLAIKSIVWKIDIHHSCMQAPVGPVKSGHSPLSLLVLLREFRDFRAYRISLATLKYTRE